MRNDPRIQTMRKCLNTIIANRERMEAFDGKDKDDDPQRGLGLARQCGMALALVSSAAIDAQCALNLLDYVERDMREHETEARQ